MLKQKLMLCIFTIILTLSLSTFSAPNADADINQVDVNKVNDSTPPGTNQQLINTSEVIQHQLFFHLENAKCGEKINIKLVQANDQSVENSEQDLTIDRNITPDSYEFTAITSANKMINIDMNQKNLLVIKIPSCNNQQNSNTNQNDNSYGNSTSTDVEPEKKDNYNFSATINVPVKTSFINLLIERPGEIKAYVNTEGKDPQIMSTDIPTTISLQP